MLFPFKSSLEPHETIDALKFNGAPWTYEQTILNEA